MPTHLHMYAQRSACFNYCVQAHSKVPGLSGIPNGNDDDYVYVHWRERFEELEVPVIAYVAVNFRELCVRLPGQQVCVYKCCALLALIASLLTQVNPYILWLQIIDLKRFYVVLIYVVFNVALHLTFFRSYIHIHFVYVV